MISFHEEEGSEEEWKSSFHGQNDCHALNKKTKLLLIFCLPCFIRETVSKRGGKEQEKRML